MDENEELHEEFSKEMRELAESSGGTYEEHSTNGAESIHALVEELKPGETLTVECRGPGWYVASIIPEPSANPWHR